MNKILATVAAAILTTGAACSQVESEPSEVVWSDMHGNAAAMEQAVNNEFLIHGVDADASTLTLDELSQAMLVFNDRSMTTDERRMQIERIVAGATAG